jgi:hypothetical protein
MSGGQVLRTERWRVYGKLSITNRHNFFVGHLEKLDLDSTRQTVASVNRLSSRCLATTGGYIYRHTDRWEGFIKYAIEMESGVMIYTPSFINTGLAIQTLRGEGYTAWTSHKPTFMFSE